MKTKIQKWLLFLLLLIVGAGGTRADDLTEDYYISGYESYNKTFFNFRTNSPAVLPTSGDLRYREGFGLHNFGSGLEVLSSQFLLLQVIF